jgi:hypothetical protein
MIVSEGIAQCFAGEDLANMPSKAVPRCPTLEVCSPSLEQAVEQNGVRIVEKWL